MLKYKTSKLIYQLSDMTEWFRLRISVSIAVYAIYE